MAILPSGLKHLFEEPVIEMAEGPRWLTLKYSRVMDQHRRDGPHAIVGQQNYVTVRVVLFPLAQGLLSGMDKKKMIQNRKIQTMTSAELSNR